SRSSLYLPPCIETMALTTPFFYSTHVTCQRHCFEICDDLHHCALDGDALDAGGADETDSVRVLIQVARILRLGERPPVRKGEHRGVRRTCRGENLLDTVGCRRR